MLEIKIERGQAPESWDEMLATSGGSAFQSTNWASLVRELRSTVPFFLTVERDGNAIALCLVLKEGLHGDRIRRSALRPFLLPIVNKTLASFCWQHGPVFLEKPGKEIADFFIAEIHKMARREKALSIAFTPHPSMGEDWVWERWLEKGYESQALATFLIDLGEDFEGKFHRSVRKNIRKCAKLGVAVEEVEEEEIPAYFRLLDNFREKAGLTRESLTSYREHVERWGERRVHFAAKYEGQIIAGLAVLLCGRFLIEVEAGDDPVCKEQGIPANEFLKAEIMRWGRERGFQSYDLAGVAIAPQNAKEAGIRKFKSKFGGEYVEFKSFQKRVGWKGALLNCAGS